MKFSFLSLRHLAAVAAAAWLRPAVLALPDRVDGRAFMHSTSLRDGGAMAPRMFNDIFAHVWPDGCAPGLRSRQNSPH